VRGGQDLRHLGELHKRLNDHRENTERDPRDKLTDHMNCLSGDREIFQRDLRSPAFQSISGTGSQYYFPAGKVNANNPIGGFHVGFPIPANASEIFGRWRNVSCNVIL
jgi:hypothetical protein